MSKGIGKMRRQFAQETIIKFSEKYDGKTIYVDKLSDEDLYAYILTTAYLYFDRQAGVGQNIEFALNSALEVASEHQLNGFKHYREACKGESIMLTDGGLK